jgi:Sigma-70 region 2
MSLVRLTSTWSSSFISNRPYGQPVRPTLSTNGEKLNLKRQIARITQKVLSSCYGDAMSIAARSTIRNGKGARSLRSVMPQGADELSDEQLMDGLDGPGVEAALSTLYDRYSRTVFGVGLKLLGERSLAEELVQEVFLKVSRSSRAFDSSRNLRRF